MIGIEDAGYTAVKESESLVRLGKLAVLALVLIAMTSPCWAINRTRISCFLIGSVQANICPLPSFFTEDPLFYYEEDPHQAGLTLDERIRLDRLYFPRSRKMLMEKFDMVFFADPYIDHFTSRQFGDLNYAFKEGGMPSYWSFGPAYGNVIEPTILSDLLPISDYQGYYHDPWHAVFRRDREPVFTPFIGLGVEKVPGEAWAWMKPRQGTVVWADMQPMDLPWIISWRPGVAGGLTWVFADEFNRYWWGLASEARGINPYSLELMANMILYSLERNLITDVLARRQARHSISGYRDAKLLILSLLDWADMFGANTFTLSERLTELDAEVTTALEHYLAEEYDASISIMDEASLSLNDIGKHAMQLKDDALFWVFVFEWMAVSAAAVIGAVAVWSLMIRRKMYRPAATTRIRYAEL